MYFGHRVRRAIPRSVQPWPSGSTFVRTAINQACTACRQARVPGEAKPACAGENRAPHSRSGRDAASGARASGAHPGRDAPAPQGLPRAQGGLQPALSRCALHDAQPPPSPFVGGGKTAASGARASGAHPGRDAPAPQGLPRAQGGLQPAPSLVARFTTPNLPLLLLWAVGKPPPQVRAPPARTPTETLQPRRGFHALREGFSPLSLVARSTTPNLPLRLLWAVGKPPPQVRAPPARTPTETLQPRRGFHALREGFSPHPLSLRASRRPTSPFAPCGSRGDEGQPRPLHPSTFLIPSGTSAPLCQIPSTCTIP
jgi:hypothetical protein